LVMLCDDGTPHWIRRIACIQKRARRPVQRVGLV
jgi:hypothetical protein